MQKSVWNDLHTTFIRNQSIQKVGGTLGIPEDTLDVIYWNYQGLEWINRIDLEDLGVSPEVINGLRRAR